MIINVTIEDRPDGGVSVYSGDLAGLVLSGRNRIAIIKAIEPAARAILEHKGLDASNIRIDATFVKSAPRMTAAQNFAEGDPSVKPDCSGADT